MGRSGGGGRSSGGFRGGRSSGGFSGGGRSSRGGFSGGFGHRSSGSFGYRPMFGGWGPRYGGGYGCGGGITMIILLFILLVSVGLPNGCAIVAVFQDVRMTLLIIILKLNM